MNVKVTRKPTPIEKVEVLEDGDTWVTFLPPPPDSMFFLLRTRWRAVYLPASAAREFFSRCLEMLDDA